MAVKGIKIKTALISVYSKDGLVDFADSLKKMKIRIISTGNTSKVLTANGIKNDEVSSVTRFPEMLDGRVKTLHPMIHGGILARRDKKDHMQTLTRHKIPTIDLVVIDLYPFEEVLRTGASRQKIIEMIDIGGPTMLRAAAKNHSGVAA
ncbi:MAG: bifunctional phosphoribosylaminoimidazolecarboxamide formyltransferase/IMP cyclohydrolase PurH, partial [Candidatus Omnitrophica bacterium]|nr:bifunctional phosphoribosylaminoimidazolecarboxamide formyltransferase/IMP cyclohydrolase PurH [Candidatus Omnitrophota bacterium]